MKKCKNYIKDDQGLTIIEVLLTVAIIAVLAAVGVISLQRYQRSLTQMERDSIAKDIFIAAQNHLSMVSGNGFSDFKYVNEPATDPAALACFGKTEKDKRDEGIFWFVVDAGVPLNDNTKLLSQMLPFGSIDETVRLGGNYIVRYQIPSEGIFRPARVLDVWYCTHNSNDRYKYTLNEYTDYMSLRSESGSREHVVGWYGGDNAYNNLATIKLEAPVIVVENGERLIVKVKDPNYRDKKGSLHLEIEGLLNDGRTDNKIKIQIRSETESVSNARVWDCTTPGGDYNYVITLDDITYKNMHFSQLAEDKLIPGENISVKAVAYSKNALANIATSNTSVRNSLFWDYDETTNTAEVKYIRHLENLDERVSDLNDLNEKSTVKLPFKAKQKSNLYWNDWTDEKGKTYDGFMSRIASSQVRETKTSKDNVLIYGKDGTTAVTKENCYLPVNSTNLAEYDGNRHSVIGIVIDYEGHAGLFGNAGIEQDLEDLEESKPDNFKLKKIHDLKLIDFKINATNGNAGALIGYLKQEDSEVENVVAYASTGANTFRIKGSGNTGGLIGEVLGGKVSCSAASLYVESTGGNAGGLIGYARRNDTAVSKIDHSYSGGHTHHTSSQTYDPYDLNVIGNTEAGGVGGLIGNAEDSEIKWCYSTCSVYNKYNSGGMGGLVGNINAAGKIDTCYATGLIGGVSEKEIKDIMKDKTTGSLVGISNGTSIKDSYYYEMINPTKDPIVFLNGVGGKPDSADDYYALDGSAEKYNSVMVYKQEAKPYDDALFKKDASGKKTSLAYPPKTVTILDDKFLTHVKKEGEEEKELTDYYVNIHYGDWPAPETLVINTPS